MVTMVNPQMSTPYFTVQLAVYNGDTHLKVVDRVHRTSGIPGNLKVELFRYKKDARSIPIYEDRSEVETIEQGAIFQLTPEGTLLLVNGDFSQPLGNHMQYTVVMS